MIYLGWLSLTLSPSVSLSLSVYLSCVYYIFVNGQFYHADTPVIIDFVYVNVYDCKHGHHPHLNLIILWASAWIPKQFIWFPWHIMRTYLCPCSHSYCAYCNMFIYIYFCFFTYAYVCMSIYQRNVCPPGSNPLLALWFGVPITSEAHRIGRRIPRKKHMFASTRFDNCICVYMCVIYLSSINVTESAFSSNTQKNGQCMTAHFN